MKLDPKHLAQLSVILELGTFQAAADKLGLTQPALSRNMRALEDRLKAPLFTRDGRRSVPNTLGKKFGSIGLSIRIAEENAANLASQTNQGSIGELRIGAPPIVAGRFLTKPLASFIKENPLSSVMLKTGLVEELRTMLERGQIDIVLGPQSLADPQSDLQFLPLIDDRVGVMCRIGHPLGGHKIGAKALEAYRWVSHSKGSLLRQQTEAGLMASGLKQTQVAFETDSIRSVLEIVAETDLLAPMPRITTAPYLEDRLQFLNFDQPLFHRPVGIIRRKASDLNQMEQRFLKILEDRSD